MVDETIQELKTYAGPGSKDEIRRFDALLRQNGWAITPRLWSRAELTCIAIVAIDPNMAFDSINQKDKKGVHWECGFVRSYSYRLQLKIIKAEAWHSCTTSCKQS